MLIKFSFNNYVNIENGKIIDFRVENDVEIYNIIKNIQLEGMPCTTKFAHDGIPGRIKSYNVNLEGDDLLEYLQTFRKIRNIETFEEFDDIDVCNEYMREIEDEEICNIVDKNSLLREYSNRYEYCIIKNYEVRFKKYVSFNLPLKKITVKVVEFNKKIIVVSLEFTKDNFTLRKIKGWLQKFKVKAVYSKEINYIKNAESIVEGIRFKSVPIILIEKGIDEISFYRLDFMELAPKYMYQKRTNAYASTGKKELEIVIDGEIIDYHFAIDIKEDSGVNANGILLTNILYMDNSEGYLCLYDNEGNKNNAIPVAMIAIEGEKAATAYINTYPEDGKEVKCVDIDLIISKI